MVVAGIEDTQPQILSRRGQDGGNGIRVSSVSRVVRSQGDWRRQLAGEGGCEEDEDEEEPTGE